MGRCVVRALLAEGSATNGRGSALADVVREQNRKRKFGTDAHNVSFLFLSAKFSFPAEAQRGLLSLLYMRSLTIPTSPLPKYQH